MYYDQQAIARRLLYEKPYWYHGNPKITLEGNEREFGKLIFDFQDEKVEFKIWIKNREEILNHASMAVININRHAQEEMEH